MQTQQFIEKIIAHAEDRPTKPLKPISPGHNGSSSEYIAYGKELEIYENNLTKFSERIRAHRAKESELMSGLEKACHVAYMPNVSDALAAKVWALAYDACHSDGLSAIEDEYSDLADLVNEGYAEGVAARN